MPNIFRQGGYRFFFFSNEGSPREPAHVHVDGDGGEAKIWLRPDVRVAQSRGYDRRALAQLIEIAQDRRDDIERAWHEHFG